MIIDKITVRCDRCGVTEDVVEDHNADRSRSGYPEPRWPPSWWRLTLRRRHDNLGSDADLCKKCGDEIQIDISKKAWK